MSIIEVKKRNHRIIFSALYVEYANEYAANEEKYAGYADCQPKRPPVPYLAASL